MSSRVLDPLTPRPVGLPLMKARVGLMNDARAEEIKRARRAADRARKGRKAKRKVSSSGRKMNR